MPFLSLLNTEFSEREKIHGLFRFRRHNQNSIISVKLEAYACPEELSDSRSKNLSLIDCKLRTTYIYIFPLLNFNKASCIVDLCLENRAEFSQEIDCMVMNLSGNCSFSESPNYSYAVLNVSLFCSVFKFIALIQLLAYNVIFCLYQLIDSWWHLMFNKWILLKASEVRLEYPLRIWLHSQQHWNHFIMMISINVIDRTRICPPEMDSDSF